MATVELKKTTKSADSIPYFLLVSRLLLFFLFQALIAEIVHWIYPTKLDDSSILEALENGCFYASRGPEIKDYQMGEDMKIKIECSPVKKIAFRTSGAGNGRVFRAEDREDLHTAEWDLSKKKPKWVRCEVTDKDGNTAWTNPIFPGSSK